MPTLRIKQIIAQRSRRVLLMADHGKFNRLALRKALDISQIHEVIADEAAPPAGVSALEEKGMRVWIAEIDIATKGGPRRETK